MKSQVQALCAGLLMTAATGSAMAADFSEGIHKNDHKWLNLSLYHGQNQRGGPFPFDDNYFEVEFGGRSGILDLYGYVDLLDIFHTSGSDKHGDANFFADIEPRFSLDAITGKDLSVGPIKEWYLAFDLLMADTAFGNGQDMDNGLQVLWMGIGTDTELPWLGKTGLNLYTRYIMDNFGASNEDSFDGYVVHANWFKPFAHFENGNFAAFQGYMDYEFGSDLDRKDSGRSSDSFQSYLGFWYHSKQWATGYGLKVYKNMTQFQDGAQWYGKEIDTTGVAHYFNVTYKF